MRWHAMTVSSRCTIAESGLHLITSLLTICPERRATVATAALSPWLIEAETEHSWPRDELLAKMEMSAQPPTADRSRSSTSWSSEEVLFRSFQQACGAETPPAELLPPPRPDCIVLELRRQRAHSGSRSLRRPRVEVAEWFLDIASC